jgi:primosomal protein N' (replication factor Y)
VISSPPRTDRIVAVGVPVPGLGLLSYRASAPLSLHKGARVRVPVGNRSVIGCIADLHAEAPPGAELKDLTDVIDEEAFVPPAVVDLALWVGEYYASGPGGALALAMPVASRRGEKESFRTIRIVELVGDEGPRESFRGERETPVSGRNSSVLPTPKRLPRSLVGQKQRALLDKLREHPEGLATADLASAGISDSTIKSLAKLGIVRIREEVSMRDPFAAAEAGEPGRWSLERAAAAEPVFTNEQAHAFTQLQVASLSQSFRTALLHGVTGSGKTELYLRLTRDVIARGHRVLVLVPEIALTPSLAGQFRMRFGDRVAIQHSALSEGERHDQWHRIRRGQVDIVVGTRSAVWSPIEQLGLIVVDEEHDSSYKQEEAPRYHGRDVAIVRARMEGALVVLGSATPSLESMSNARAGRYEEVRLTKRVLNRPLASVRVVSMRDEYAREGADVALSQPLLEAIRDRLGKGEQTVVLLNRRGFATVVFCRQCGASMECPHCSVSLTFHKLQRRVRCHYCNYSAPVPQRCGACGGEYLEQSGVGTERLEADLRARFPGARVVRVDRDTMRRRGAITGILSAVERGDIDILVGTQMIAKGHDFPAVTLVGVVSADVGLGLADFRASERTFQLLTQVVGRAGRGSTPGDAIIQTLYPDHYAVRSAAAQDFETFYTREMEFRASLRYPPAVALINVVVKDKAADRAMTAAHDLVVRTRHHHPHGQVIGPAPAAIAKVKDEYRAQFFIKGHKRRAMRDALTRALDERHDLKRKVIVDVDPVNVL